MEQKIISTFHQHKRPIELYCNQIVGWELGDNMKEELFWGLRSCGFWSRKLLTCI